MSWYKTWFGPEYLELYPHRNQDEATRQIDFLLAQIPLQPQTPILDIACGTGRHVFELRSRGYINSVGVDISDTLLELGNSVNSGTEIEKSALFPIPLLKGDMRNLPFAEGTFHLALSMFTSFGYFSTDREHLQALYEWNRVLPNQGLLFIDYLNSDFVRKNLVQHNISERGGMCFEEHRSITSDGKRVDKVIQIQHWPSSEIVGSSSQAIGTTETLTSAQQHLGNNKTSDEHINDRYSFRESVRLFSFADFEFLLEEAGFEIICRFGGFDGQDFGTDSPRLIMICKKFATISS